MLQQLLSRAKNSFTLEPGVIFEHTWRKRSLDDTHDSTLQGKGRHKKLRTAPTQEQTSTLEIRLPLNHDILPLIDTERCIVESAEVSNKMNHSKQTETNLLSLPQDVLISVMTYLTTVQDRQSCITVCCRFRQLRDFPIILSKQMLESHPGASFDGASISNVYSGILRDAENSLEAFDLLYKFASVDNMDALYMIGMVLIYCHGSNLGINLLEMNASRNCVLSQYALGLILRDSNEVQSKHYLQTASDAGSLAAYRELNPSRKNYEDSPNNSLNSFYPPNLFRFTRKCFISSKGLRNVNTSHCWNPHCGRWALKRTRQEVLKPADCLPPLPHMHKLQILSLLGNMQRENDVANSFIVHDVDGPCRIARMQMCSHCLKAKYCSKQCQVYDWKYGLHRMECTHLQEDRIH